MIFIVRYRIRHRIRCRMLYRIRYRIRHRIRHRIRYLMRYRLQEGLVPPSLVFFSTFEPISLAPDSSTQRNGFPMLYKRASSQLPTLYVCPMENVLGKVPLIPCFLCGNKDNTIPHSLRHHVPDGAAADSRPYSGTGSRLFEVNIWMWNYGRALNWRSPERSQWRMQRG